MAINLKAKEILISIGKYRDTYRFVMSPMIYNRLSEQKVIEEASVRSGLTKSSIDAAWSALSEVLKAWATEGHSVPIPGVGTMRFGVKATSASSVDKVSTDLITARKIIFTPSPAIKNELKNTSISISCYDRNGKLVRTVSPSEGEMGDFEVELISSPEGGGTFEGAGFYNEHNFVTVKAVPAEGYQFVRWDDDVTDIERVLDITDDVCLVATFRRVSAGGTQQTTGGTQQTTGGSGSAGGATGSGSTGNSDNSSATDTEDGFSA